MPSLIALVEGDGDREAVPVLVRRLLYRAERSDWRIERTKMVGGFESLRHRLDDHLRYLRIEAPDAALIVLDLEDHCPVEEARVFSQRIEEQHLPFPVAVVFARREFEAWFLAAIESVSASRWLPDGLVYEGDPEARRGCKEWLTDQMPQGVSYKPTLHQAPLCEALDIEVAASRSRSFRRLVAALDEIVTHSGVSGYASPGSRP